MDHIRNGLGHGGSQDRKRGWGMQKMARTWSDFCRLRRTLHSVASFSTSATLVTSPHALFSTNGSKTLFSRMTSTVRSLLFSTVTRSQLHQEVLLVTPQTWQARRRFKFPNDSRWFRSDRYAAEYFFFFFCAFVLINTIIITPQSAEGFALSFKPCFPK